MQLLLGLFAITGLTSAAIQNTTREFVLRTEVKKVTKASKQFNGLFLTSYHTGAGLGDATLDGVSQSKAFINSSNGNLLFDLGNDFPWYMENVVTETFYAGWQPVRINAGSGGSDTFASGFFLNETGLQWTTTPSQPGGASDAFGGWLVCEWWHGVPQLFARLAAYDTPVPSSCADVRLCQTYL